jgi:hypothetical protein
MELAELRKEVAFVAAEFSQSERTLQTAGCGSIELPL